MRGEMRGPPAEMVLRCLKAGEPVLSLGVRGARTSDIARMALGAGYDYCGSISSIAACP